MLYIFKNLFKFIKSLIVLVSSKQGRPARALCDA